MKRKKRSRRMNGLVSIVITILTVAAIRQQLQLPSEERTWHGKIFGIPYDFRFPTVERVRLAFWNKDTSQILVPQPFGIGWSVNLYPLLHFKTAPSI